MQCKIKNMKLSYDYFKKSAQLVLEVDGQLPDLEQETSELCAKINAGKRVTACIEVKKNKRSLDSNAYAWVLIHKIAERIDLDAVTVYRETIRDIGGCCEVICVPEKRQKRVCDGWSRNGIGWITDTMPSKIPGCVNVILYYGSSAYDQRQMGRLIDRLVEECKLLGIETLSPLELEQMKARWSA